MRVRRRAKKKKKSNNFYFDVDVKKSKTETINLRVIEESKRPEVPKSKDRKSPITHLGCLNKIVGFLQQKKSATVILTATGFPS